MCAIAVPLTFIQYFYTRERITEERRATEGEGELVQVKEASFGTQLKACLKDKYWVMFIILIFVYQVLNALKSVSQIYYAGWVVAGNAYGEAAAIQARFTMIAMAPMGPMLFVVLPLIKKFGRTKMIILGSAIAFVGALIAFFGAGSTMPVYAGTGLGGVGAMFYVYTMMSFTGDAIDHVEYSQHVRVEGVTAALVGFMHSLANGIGQGLFNLGLMMSKYTTPEMIGTVEKKGKLIELYADQTAGATTWINFSYQGAIALTALLFLILFVFFFDIDKRMPEVTHALIERKKAECAAKGIPYVSHEEQMKAEIAQQQAEAEENRIKEKQARKICEEKIAKHKLVMKLVNVEYTFDNSKIIFYFTADGRVDFRALVKDLASVFRTRIELRQIGVRDEAKMLGGMGICGRPFCCSRFMGEFQPVSIKMAKEQGLSLSPTKISGTCGRLMCCLKYEQEAYTDLLKHTPKVGAIVNTPEGRGLVVENNLIARTLKVKLDNAPADVAPKTFTVRQCKLVRDGYIKVNKKELEQLGNLE